MISAYLSRDYLRKRMTHKLYIIAVESSADHLGAQLIKDLKTQSPTINCIGIGGPAMQAQGVEPEIDISGLAILGFVEGISAYPMIMKRVRQTVSSIIEVNPAAVILIDSWGFMIRVAKNLKKAGYKGKVIKYVAPQVWAMREGRAKILADNVDHVMTIHNFDAPYFEQHGLPVTYIGNPIFDTDYRAGNGTQIKSELGFAQEGDIVSVFFGSRLSEIKTLAPVFAETVQLLKQKRSHLKFISPVADSIATDVRAAAAMDTRLQDIILLPESKKLDVFDASTVALACSGTVTTQLACAGVPTVVAYKLNAMTFAVAKRLYKPEYISLVNISAGESLLPEFVQGDVTVKNIVQEILKYVDDADYRKSKSEQLLSQTAFMHGKGGFASKRAAQTVLSLLG